MTLSVVSVFARLGNDPWQEAGRLAGLPKPEAIESLARIIASMPTSVWPLQAATTIATRLIALLPTQTGNLDRVRKYQPMVQRSAELLELASCWQPSRSQSPFKRVS